MTGQTGDQGCDGISGIQGIDGPVGPAGPPGLVSEFYDTDEPDFQWVDATPTTVPGMTHDVSADGTFQVHVHLSNTLATLAVGIIRLKANGVVVQILNLQDNLDTVTVRDDVSMVWEGPLLSAETIEVEVEQTGVPQVTTYHYSMLINKVG